MTEALDLARRADAALAGWDADLARLWPGPVTWRQPVHTVYVPADRFGPGLAAEWGAAALETWRAHCGGAAALADLLAHAGFPAPDEPAVRAIGDRVAAKLHTEPVEDLRIDFEDGFTQAGIAAGDRWAHEDAVLDDVLGVISREGPPAPYWGIRFKALEPATRRRGITTLAGLLLGLRDAGIAPGPRQLRLTVPKATSAEQIRVVAGILGRLEEAGAPAAGIEIQVETPQSVLGADGTCPLPGLITAGAGRVLSLHYGTYDYSAFLGIAAADQAMDHPAADHAKDVMQVAVAGRGVELSDGSTNLLPVGGADAIRRAWVTHARLVGRHLSRGIWQGWDLHPNQLPTRYAATYAWFAQRLPDAVARLDAYLAGRGGAVADEPATARALASFLRRAVDCGALPPAELHAATGLEPGDLAIITVTGAAP